MKTNTLLFLILGFLTWITPDSTFACLNDGGYFSIKSENPIGTEEVYDGDFLEAKRGAYFMGYPQYLQSQYTKKDWESHLALLQKKIRADRQPDMGLLTSYGVALAHVGEYQKALDIFLALEKEKPGLYSNAANLGTTYELLGNNESALKWIQEGLARDPNSHQGTEWLHVKILETKLQLVRDPDWLKNHGVLGWDWGHGLWASRPPTLEANESKRLVLALHHQLHERLQFVKPPDPIVGDLLFDLASLAALEAGPTSARDLYQLSVTYQPTLATIADLRTRYYGLRAGLGNAYTFANNWALFLSFWAFLAFAFIKGISYYRNLRS